MMFSPGMRPRSFRPAIRSGISQARHVSSPILGRLDGGLCDSQRGTSECDEADENSHPKGVLPLTASAAPENQVEVHGHPPVFWSPTSVEHWAEAYTQMYVEARDCRRRS